MDNFRASLLMVLAMALFVVEDALIKVLAQTLPVAQVMFVLGLGGGALFAVVAYMRGISILTRDAVRGLCAWRNLMEVLGGFCMIQALAMIPVSTASAILQAVPLVVTLGAALFLGETVGWRRWTAVFVGFVGVLVILRPGTGEFDAHALWAVATVVFLAVRDLITRQIPAHVRSLQLAAWGFLAFVPAGLLHLPFGGALVMPDTTILWVIFAALIFGPLGYIALVNATRIGEASAIAPYRYTRLIFALIIGAIAFGERPDIFMIVGAAIVVSAGLYTFARETRMRRREPS